jgi:redox-regulated HSP33 family molecular chaperone
MSNRIPHENLKAADLDKVREWGKHQAPSVVDEATGSAIASSIWRGGNFKKASELALQYNESSPNDEVLAAFLKSDEVRHQSAGKAKALIDKIKDPALQAEIRDLPQYKK